MRQRLPVLSALALILTLAACAALLPSEDSGGFQLYFLSTGGHGPAISGTPYAGQDPTAEELLSALLAGPEEDGLRSPFPAGVYLRGTELEEGLLTVDFSEQYGGLSDISLTLADYCVVCTVCQLEEVEAVAITVSGRQMNYRSHQILTPADVKPWEEQQNT